MLSRSRHFLRATHPAALGTAMSMRYLSTSSPWKAFDGSTPDDHVTRKKDEGNVQNDASKAGMAEKATGEGSVATSEKDQGNKNKKAKEDHPEAPGVVMGMNDERGGKGR